MKNRKPTQADYLRALNRGKAITRYTPEGRAQLRMGSPSRTPTRGRRRR